MESDQSRVLSLMSAGEALVWWGRPDPTVLFAKADAFLIPFSLFWGGFALFWEYRAITDSHGPLLVIWGIPFVALGVHMIVGRFFYKRWRKRRTVYVLSSERVMELRGATAVRELWLPLSNVESLASGDGQHLSVTFGTPELAPGRRRNTHAMYANTGMDFFDRSTGVISFFDVADITGLAAGVAQLRAPSR